MFECEADRVAQLFYAEAERFFAPRIEEVEDVPVEDTQTEKRHVEPEPKRRKEDNQTERSSSHVPESGTPESHTPDLSDIKPDARLVVWNNDGVLELAQDCGPRLLALTFEPNEGVVSTRWVQQAVDQTLNTNKFKLMRCHGAWFMPLSMLRHLQRNARVRALCTDVVAQHFRRATSPMTACKLQIRPCGVCGHEDAKEFVALACRHSFHIACLVPRLFSQSVSQPTCPCCGRTLSNTDKVRLTHSTRGRHLVLNALCQLRREHEDLAKQLSEKAKETEAHKETVKVREREHRQDLARAKQQHEEQLKQFEVEAKRERDAATKVLDEVRAEAKQEREDHRKILEVVQVASVGSPCLIDPDDYVSTLMFQRRHPQLFAPENQSATATAVTQTNIFNWLFAHPRYGTEFKALLRDQGPEKVSLLRSLSNL
jgi:hypothetical protein